MNAPTGRPRGVGQEQDILLGQSVSCDRLFGYVALAPQENIVARHDSRKAGAGLEILLDSGRGGH